MCLRVITNCDVCLLRFWFGDGWFYLSLSRCDWSRRQETIFGRHLFLLVSGRLMFPCRFAVILHGGQSVCRELWLVFCGFTNDGRSGGQQS